MFPLSPSAQSSPYVAKRAPHAFVLIGIHPDYRGQGIGSKLFAHLEQWANERDIHRLELTVVCENEAGVASYKKHGFEVEGTKRDSLFIDGTYYDEYYMAKLL
ncbi:MAG TPA: GNAT family N-acetyltransferase [Candidatus Avamphibacillus sp.]|nr:GNAT family N-acetyltransferase [Candidatus Avamphibacillus sp.]